MGAPRVAMKSAEQKAAAQPFSSSKASECLALAIPASVSGTDAAGRRFEELTQTVLIHKLGAKLLTGKELNRGSSLKVTALSTKRTAQARVIWIGERTGDRYEIGVELEDSGGLWGVQFPGGSVPRKSSAPSGIAIVARSQEAPEGSTQESGALSEKELPRQRESSEPTAEAMPTPMSEMALSSKAQLEMDAAEIVSTSSSSLRRSLEQELARLEEQFSEQCRTRAERILSCHLEESANSLASSVREAEEEIARQMGALAGRFAAEMEQRCERALADAVARIEKQLEEAAERVEQSFLRHIVSDLNERQSQWIEQTVQAIEEAAGQNLRRARGEISRLMKGLAESVE